ncbi:hypothetical protein [Alloscardovia macacae]|uniref:Uncharacterized protein n=1 Tax=Alloscardovia macacae TaxID=1160091 RepID=A0A261F4L5_9BIFI|nr:hypothetical protein [Alloscardovia macacae]OZG54060.1 hypothetical protein ALMA_1024 [Alloscardovia macacae]
MTSAKAIEERANNTAYTLNVVRDFILSAAFGEGGVNAASAYTWRTANVLATYVYLDHCGIDHPAVECVGTKDMPAFFMTVFAAALMDKSTMRVGVQADPAQSVIQIPETPQYDVNRYESALGRFPFYRELNDLMYMYRRVHESAQSNVDTIRIQKDPFDYCMRLLAERVRVETIN